MKKYYTVLALLLAMLMIMSACGSSTTDTTAAEVTSESVIPAEPSSEPTVAPTETPKVDDKLDFNDIDWSVDEGIVSGDRYMLLDITNNSNFDITYFEVEYALKDDVSEDLLQNFYTHLKEKFDASDDDIDSLKSLDTWMYAECERILEPGDNVSDARCYYFSGYYYMDYSDILDLVDPDIATVKYISDGNIVTMYYDFHSSKVTTDSKTEVANQWEDTKVSALIPKPDVKVLTIGFSDDDMYTFDAYGLSLNDFNDYVDACKTMGFTEDSYEHDGYFSADLIGGSSFSCQYDEDDQSMSCHLYAEISDLDPSSVAAGTETLTGIRPEFQEAMDAYVAICSEYADAYKAYMANSSDSTAYENLCNVLDSMSDIETAFNDWGDKQLSSEEEALYQEVSDRVGTMLLDVM